MINEETAGKIMANYNLNFARIRNDIRIEGSPERTQERLVAEDNKGNLFIIENIFEKDFLRKRKINEVLRFFAGKGIEEINQYLVNNKGEEILELNEQYWQIQKYIESDTLDREKYIFEGFRGKIFADFLIRLRKAAEEGDAGLFDRKKKFSIFQYIDSLLLTIRKNNAPVFDFLEKEGIISALSGFADVEKKIPQIFCHGDYHPVNTLWKDDLMINVIDWEFCGIKPEIYDIANLLGCVGMEDPDALEGDLAKEFVVTIRKSGFIDDLSWDNLVLYMFALRFAWLSEWLRKGDVEMIDLETTYMKILLKNKEKYQKQWYG